MKIYLYFFPLLLFCISSKISCSSNVDYAVSEFEPTSDEKIFKETVVESFVENLRICIRDTTESARKFFLKKFMVSKRLYHSKKTNSTGTCSDDRAAAYSKLKDAMVANMKDYAQKIIAKRPIDHVKKIIIKYFKTLPTFNEPCTNKAARDVRMKEMARREAVCKAIKERFPYATDLLTSAQGDYASIFLRAEQNVPRPYRYSDFCSGLWWFCIEEKVGEINWTERSRVI